MSQTESAIRAEYYEGGDLLCRGAYRFSRLHAIGEPFVMDGRALVVVAHEFDGASYRVWCRATEPACGECGGTAGSSVDCICAKDSRRPEPKEEP